MEESDGIFIQIGKKVLSYNVSSKCYTSTFQALFLGENDVQVLDIPEYTRKLQTTLTGLQRILRILVIVCLRKKGTKFDIQKCLLLSNK